MLCFRRSVPESRFRTWSCRSTYRRSRKKIRRRGSVPRRVRWGSEPQLRFLEEVLFHGFSELFLAREELRRPPTLPRRVHVRGAVIPSSPVGRASLRPARRLRPTRRDRKDVARDGPTQHDRSGFALAQQTSDLQPTNEQLSVSLPSSPPPLPRRPGRRPPRLLRWPRPQRVRAALLAPPPAALGP